MYFFGYDPTYILVIIGAVICILASSRVNRVFNKYAQVRSHSGMTGREAAEKILRANGIYDVTVQHVSGNLTDHYDPRNKVLRLSDATYQSASVAAIGVAAHECGHAVQHNVGYTPLKIRGALVPVANFGSMAAWPLIIIGLFIDVYKRQALYSHGAASVVSVCDDSHIHGAALFPDHVQGDEYQDGYGIFTDGQPGGSIYVLFFTSA